jgi:SAM-dependent methyltransferase
VGAGPGRMARQLGPYFDQCRVAVEANPELWRHYDRAEGEGKGERGITLFRGAWGDYPEGGEPFDLIVCSHVLYHMSRPVMTRFVEKLLRFLHPEGGVLVIALMAPRGASHRLHAMFNPGAVGQAGADRLPGAPLGHHHLRWLHMM